MVSLSVKQLILTTLWLLIAKSKNQYNQKLPPNEPKLAVKLAVKTQIIDSVLKEIDN